MARSRRGLEACALQMARRPVPPHSQRLPRYQGFRWRHALCVSTRAGGGCRGLPPHTSCKYMAKDTWHLRLKFTCAEAHCGDPRPPIYNISL